MADTPASSPRPRHHSEDDYESRLSRLRSRLVGFAIRRVGPQQAEDLAQEVLCLLTEKYPTVREIEDLLPLSFRILRLKMLAWRRKASRRGEDRSVPVDGLPLQSSTPDPHRAAERRDLLLRIERALRGMGERCRELLRHKLLGRSFGQIQELMGARTMATVYTWDHRCRKQLLQALGGHWEAW